MKAGDVGLWISVCLIPHTTNEASALDHYVHCGRNIKLHAAQEGVDVDLLVLGDDSLAQIHADAAAEGIQPGSLERLSLIHIFVGTEVNRTVDAFSLVTDRQGASKPLVTVTHKTFEQQFYAYIY